MIVPGPRPARARQLAVALREVRELEELAWNAPFGCANADALSRFEQAEVRLRSVIPSGQGREKLGEVTSWARVLYSERERREWGDDGTELVRRFMVAALQGVQQGIEQALAGRRTEAAPDGR